MFDAVISPWPMLFFFCSSSVCFHCTTLSFPSLFFHCLLSDVFLHWKDCKLFPEERAADLYTCMGLMCGVGSDAGVNPNHGWPGLWGWASVGEEECGKDGGGAEQWHHVLWWFAAQRQSSPQLK